MDARAGYASSATWRSEIRFRCAWPPAGLATAGFKLCTACATVTNAYTRTPHKHNTQHATHHSPPARLRNGIVPALLVETRLAATPGLQLPSFHASNLASRSHHTRNTTGKASSEAHTQQSKGHVVLPRGWNRCRVSRNPPHIGRKPERTLLGQPRLQRTRATHFHTLGGVKHVTSQHGFSDVSIRSIVM